VVGVEFWRDLTYNQHWHAYLALLAAITLAMTIELGGAFAAMGLTTFWQQRSWIRMFIALAALVGYSYFGITLTWGTRLWPVFIFVSLLYLVFASLDTHRAQRAEERSEKELDLAISKQVAAAARARAREAAFSGFETKNGLKINENVRVYLETLKDPESAKIQEIADASGVSIGTASEHKRRFLAQRPD
jgi:uncharacterized membrane protein